MTNPITPFAATWETYVERGWQPFPLPEGKKFPPPSGTTGTNGKPLTKDQLAHARGGNIGHRLPLDVIGIDIDNGYIKDGRMKTGLLTMEDLENELGELPPTFVSTSRPLETQSGIFFYRVPPGMAWRDPGHDVETIWWGHRYAVAAPSVHPDTDSTYRCYSPDGEEMRSLPHVNDLPQLPEAWIRYLRKAAGKRSTGGVDFADEEHIENYINYALANLEEANTNYRNLIFAASGAIAAATFARAKNDNVTVDEAQLRKRIEREVLMRTPWDKLDNEDLQWIQDGIDKNRDSTLDTPDEKDRRLELVTDDSGLGELLTAVEKFEAPKLPGHPAREHAIVAHIVAEALSGRYLYVERMGWHQWDGARWSPHCPTPVRHAVESLIRRNTETPKKIRSAVEFNSDLREAKAELVALKNARGGQGKDAVKGAREQELEQKIQRIDDWARRWDFVGEWWAALAHGQNYKHVMDFVQVSPSVFTLPTELDRHEHLLNCPNGTIDLRSGEIKKHDPRDLITKTTGVEYDYDAQHPLWDKAREAFAPGVEAWLKRRIGAGAFGRPDKEENMLFSFGAGSNGKSTLTDAIMSSLGEYAVFLHDKAVLGSPNDHGAEKMVFRGARWCILEELPEAQILRPQMIKKLIGTSRISARMMRENPVTFDATHSVIINSNHVPLVPEQDHGTWRRLVSIPWPYTFKFDGDLTNEYDRPGDHEVKAALKANLEVRKAALAWIVEGAVAYTEASDNCGEFPDVVRESTERWKSSNDILGQFLEEHCIVESGFVVTSVELLEQFNEYLESLGKNHVSDAYIRTRIGEGKYSSVEAKKVRLSNKLKLSWIRPLSEKPATVRGYVGLRWKDASEQNTVSDEDAF